MVVLLLALPSTLTAAVGRTEASPQPIYAAFSLLKQGKLTTNRCGGDLITTGTTPDARQVPMRGTPAPSPSPGGSRFTLVARPASPPAR